MAIYKYPSTTENSVMPFVYTCPAPKTILNRLDKLFVYGNYEEIKLAESQLTLPFVIMENRAKRLGLLDCVAYGRYFFYVLTLLNRYRVQEIFHCQRMLRDRLKTESKNTLLIML